MPMESLLEQRPEREDAEVVEKSFSYRTKPKPGEEVCEEFNTGQHEVEAGEQTAHGSDLLNGTLARV